MKLSSASRWFIVLGYVALIYSTLESIGAPIQFLRHHNLLRLSLFIFYSISLLLLFLALWLRQTRTWWRYFLIFSLFIFSYLIGKSTGTPEEEIHFFEYGLVGILFARALYQHTKNYLTIVTLSFLAGTLVGFIDEKIQGTLPTRHYDLKDVIMNAVSVFFGLCVWSLIPRTQTNIRETLKK